MKSIYRVATLALSVALVGCANLKEVSDFASESAKFSAYTELTTRFRDTYEREQPYVSGSVQTKAKLNDKKRKEAYRDFVKIHQRVAVYMQTLAVLAGATTFDLSKEIDSLAAGIKSYPDLGITEKQVSAFSSLSKVIAKWISSAAQERAVREMLKSGDPHLQVLLEGMADLVRIYQKTNENERKQVLGFFEVEILYANTPKDKLLAVLAKAHLQSKSREYHLVNAKYTQAQNGIARLKAGHKALLENIDQLSSGETKTLIRMFSNDIKTIRDKLHTL